MLIRISTKTSSVEMTFGVFCIITGVTGMIGVALWRWFA